MDQNHSGISLNDLFEISLPGFATGVENLSLVICSTKESFDYQYSFVTINSPATKWLFPDFAKESVYIFPLYLNQENRLKPIDKINEQTTSNLNQEIVNQFAKKLSLHFNDESEYTNQENNSPVCYANSEEVSEDFRMDIFPSSFAPIDLLDYVYAILHSGKFNEKYNEELRKEFPVVPIPKNQIIFWKLVTLGKNLRKLHLLEGPEVEKYITKFPVEGKNIVNKIRFEENYEIIDGDDIIHITPLYAMGRAYINEKQFFQKVPKLAWELSLGNHHPAREWLENKMGSVLTKVEIMRYQKIIITLFETDRIRNEMDTLRF